MPLRVAINGFGRIGRLVLRIGKARKGLQFVAINDLVDPATLAHLFQYDSVHRTYPGKVAVEGNEIVVDGERIRCIQEKDPTKLPWKDMGVDIVVESTGKFRKRAELENHITAGAKHVLLSAPPKDALDAIVVMGINDEVLKSSPKVFSLASCTTNCCAPLAHVIHRKWGISSGHLATIHAYTNDQATLDQPHKDLRRARAAAVSIIPTSTGAAKSMGQVIPELAGRFSGVAYRVPIPTGSIIDMILDLKKPATPQEINAEVRRASENEMKGIIEYTEKPIVSADIVGDPHSCIFDSEYTIVTGERSLKVVAWYDNEWGYSTRVVDVMERLSK